MILTPPQFFGCSKQQLHGHSSQHCETFPHNGIIHFEERPENGVTKVFPSNEIDVKRFQNLLTAFRFFQIDPPAEYLSESDTLEAKYIKPVLWFREHFLLPRFPEQQPIRYDVREIGEDSTSHIRIYSDSPENSKDHLLMIFVFYPVHGKKRHLASHLKVPIFQVPRIWSQSLISPFLHFCVSTNIHLKIQPPGESIAITRCPFDGGGHI
ncbi:hypothetical protein C8Q75DRAFT_576461 [Abortiporus biennis]|nr:hypothetical protein C8Q75DRAFT_576461 [Abortiporus biennis]